MQIRSFSNNFTSTVTSQHKTGAEQARSKITATRKLSEKDEVRLINTDRPNLQITSMTQQIQNENTRIGMLQTVDSILKEIQSGADHLSELLVASNDTTPDSDQRDMLSKEFNSTRQAMGSLMEKTTYGGKTLLGNNSVLGLGRVDMSEVSIDNEESLEALTSQVNSLFSDAESASQKTQVSINNLLAGISNATLSLAGALEAPTSQNINQLSQSSTELTASIMAQSHNTAILQQQMVALLNF